MFGNTYVSFTTAWGDLKCKLRPACVSPAASSVTIPEQFDYFSAVMGFPLHSSVVCRGLTSESGQNNCFLNVIIQSLWHLRAFRECMLAFDLAKVPAASAPPGDAGIMLALRSIFCKFQEVR